MKTLCWYFIIPLWSLTLTLTMFHVTPRCVMCACNWSHHRATLFYKLRHNTARRHSNPAEGHLLKTLSTFMNVFWHKPYIRTKKQSHLDWFRYLFICGVIFISTCITMTFTEVSKGPTSFKQPFPVLQQTGGSFHQSLTRGVYPERFTLDCDGLGWHTLHESREQR